MDAASPLPMPINPQATGDTDESPQTHSRPPAGSRTFVPTHLFNRLYQNDPERQAYQYEQSDHLRQERIHHIQTNNADSSVVSHELIHKAVPK